MGTITAPSEGPNTATPPAETPPLWQAPVFVLGVAALVAVWFARPLFQDCSARRVENDLAAARQLLLTRADGDAEQALQLAQEALDRIAVLPDKAGEAHYLAGCAHVRLAEKADPVRGRESWLRAKEALDQAARAGVSEDDAPELAYRIAKAAYFLGEPLPGVIAQLEEAAPKSAFRAEGYRLLCEAYLKLPKPNLTKALAANTSLRNVAEATEADLAAAKLQGGEILLRMGKTEEARAALAKISEQAAPAVVGKARLLRARSYQEEKQWGEASRLYLAAQAVVTDQAPIYYNLGLCYRNLDQPQEAVKAWQECVRVSRGPEGAAAAVTLAELRLAEPALEPALEMLTLAAAHVSAPASWSNPLVDAKKAADVFDRAFAAFRQASRHDLALRLLDPYTKLAPAVRVLALKGEVASEWARAKLDSPPVTADGRKLAEDLYRSAGEAYSTAAETKDLKLTEQGDYLWKAAQSYLAAKEDAQAASRLKQVVTMNLEPARLGEAWYRLAEVYRAGNRAEAAQKAYGKCMEYDTLYAHRARYALAMVSLEKGDLDEAEAALVFNHKMLQWESDPEGLSQTLFALGNLLYQRRDYRRVARYLERAIGRFKDDPEVTRARYQLADSYRQIAAQENQSFLLGDTMSAEARAHFQKNHREWLQKAADEFAALERLLESPGGREHLTPELREQVPFIAAKCWFNLGAYDKALAIYEKLIDRHPAKKEGLDALGGAVSCHAALGQLEKVKQRLLQIKTALPQMPDDVRKPWEDWLAEAVKPLNEL